MPIFVWAILGGAVAVWWINSSVQTWKPIATGTPIVAQALDSYAYLAMQKPGTGVKFAVTQGGGSNAIIAGSVQNVYVQGGVRYWNVKVEAILTYTGTKPPPSKGEIFTLVDANLMP